MTEDEIAPLYCAIMEELKARVDTVGEVVHGISRPQSEQHLRHNIFMFDGLYLQLRKTCELLAIAILVSQSANESARSSSLLKQYRADQLIDRVAEINPLSFPRPVEPGLWAAGTVEMVRPVAPVFTALELKKLYFDCDDRMHVGKLRDLLRSKTKELNQDVIKEWVQRLVAGLANHAIALPDKRRSMLVKMADPENGRVSCRFAALQP